MSRRERSIPKSSTPITTGGLGALLLILAACGGAGVDSARYLVEDSAGVRIVTSTASVRDPAISGWTVADVPGWSIGSIDGPEAHSFTRILNAWVSEDGYVRVVEATTSTVRSFDSVGELVSEIGGQGEGPGEFRALGNAIPYRGDSIAAWDASRQLLSVFDGRGRLVRSQPIALAGLGDVARGQGPLSNARAGRLIGAFHDGSLLFTQPDLVRFQYEGPWTWRQHYTRYSADGERLNDVAEYYGTERMAAAAGAALSFTAFPHEPRVAASSSAVYVTPAPDFELRSHGFDAPENLRVIGRLDREPRRVDGAARSAFERSIREDPVYTSFSASALNRALAAAAYPEHLPAFDRLLVDDLGYVWVRCFSLPGDDAVEWLIFTEDLRLRQTIEMPPIEVTQIGEDFVLGVRTDELGVPYVERYALRR